MVTYFFGIPLLFIQRWPKLSRAYALYALSFVLVSLGSKLLWGHCFLTPLSSALWNRSAWPVAGDEWFTERIAKRIFDAAPSRQSISWIADGAILVIACGAILHLRARTHSNRRNARGGLGVMSIGRKS
jgi:hypothetical protein